MFYVIYKRRISSAILNIIIWIICVVYAENKINLNFSNSVFNFHNIEDCGNNEYYDLNYFSCIPCDRLGIHLQPSSNRFSCRCKSTNITSVTTIYDRGNSFVLRCTDYCHNKEETLGDSNREFFINLCANITTANKIQCKYKYVNSTKGNYTSGGIEISFVNPYLNSKCQECDLTHNYHYQGYCIAKELIRPYLRYNFYWSLFSRTFDELKFVVFFCISLHNDTACNYLANLCVSSFYSMARYSPCHKFLQTQTNVQLPYTIDNMSILETELKPFLFYRKGKQTVNMLNNHIDELKLTFNAADEDGHDLPIFNIIQSRGGQLVEWGSLKLWRLNLCYNSIKNDQTIQFAKPFQTIQCFLTVEQVIDLANTRYSSKSFYNLYLKYTQNGRELLYPIPLLIKNLTHENQMTIAKDWLLVKRFQLIELYNRYNATFMYHSKQSVKYNNSHYLTQYRALRYADNIEFQYVIHDHNSLSIPLIKLNYRQVDFNGNFSLSSFLPFKFSVKYNRFKGNEDSKYNDILLGCLLILAIIMSLIRAILLRKRYVTITLQTCDDSSAFLRTFMEFLLEMMNYLAIIFIIYFFLTICLSLMKYHTQEFVEILLPITNEKQNLLNCFSYAAALLQTFYVSIQLYRMSRYDIYLIDWERPRFGDSATPTNYWNFKFSQFRTSTLHSPAGANTISAWRSILVVNKWIQLSSQKSAAFEVQFILIYAVFMIFSTNNTTVNLSVIIISYIKIYILLYIWRNFILKYLWRIRPVHQQFVDLCSMSNMSLFILTDSFYGYYIHGRSTFGFADTDITTILIHLAINTKGQRRVCAGRGLFSDNDQCFIVVPPMNLNRYLQKLYLSAMNEEEVSGNSQLFQVPLATANRISTFYNNVNRFFCAFIDHGIKEMDYIIKERPLLERLLNHEFNRYLTETKGTFYVDGKHAFMQMWLYGNEGRFFWLNISLLLAYYLIFNNFVLAIILTYTLNQVLQVIYSMALKCNICRKTFIDKRLFDLTF